ncbi:flagellar FliJ family protein [Oribacterium sp. oral taxon 102]|uniref:flagellar export protein FliJ n=1 Tax=Oribacterium sp. oral taxon 102 TaxID=671214 RepID=UPI0015C1256B|nr:flagellar FliJ family protein [Oribacterium sp. oral taxon 102]NWO21812.1 flagellar FliJ family protein [Oribacterium sp. oral taxon 102]
MKKFQYSLETVMDYKTQLLDRVQREFSEVMARLRRQRQYLELLYERRRELETEFGKLKQRGGAIQRFQLFQEVLDRRSEEILLEEGRLRKLQEETDRKQTELVEAKVDVSKFEKLKEHKLSDYQRDIRKADERFIEEFIIHKR